jgi:hypothetical protein
MICEKHNLLDPCEDCAAERNRTQRTDFSGWQRSTLEQFARQAADENLELREQNKALLVEWRKLVVSTEGAPA